MAPAAFVHVVAAAALAVAALVAILWRFAWQLAAPLGAAIGWLAGSVIRIRREHVEESLRAAGIDDRVAGAMYRSLGRGLCELGALALSPRRALAKLDLSAAESVLSQGQGAVIATAHTGNWDLLGCAAAARWPLTVVTKRLSVGVLDRLWQGLRRGRGVSLVGAGSAARSAARALRRGELVAMMIDQAPERSRGAVRVAFMGQSAWVDLAPALVAMRARVPLVVVFSHRRADGSHASDLAGVIEPPSRPERAWAESAMRQATAWLETHVRRHPAEYLWMHRRWKDAPVQSSSHPGVVASGAR